MGFLLKLLPALLGFVRLILEAVAQSVVADWVLKKLSRKKRK